MPTEIDPNYSSLFAGGYRLRRNESTVDLCIKGSIEDCEDKTYFGLEIDEILVSETFYDGYLVFNVGSLNRQFVIPVQDTSGKIRFIQSSVDKSGRKMIINYGKCELSN